MIDTHIERLVRRMPTLETQHLVLRKLIPQDAQDMYEYCSDSDTPKYLTWEPHESLKYTKEYIRYVIKKYKTGEYLDWGITLKANGKLIGTCGFTLIETEHSKGEIGYVLNASYRNQGYATEAVKRLLEYSFFELELNRIEARVMEHNDSSVALLKKCGFEYEGTFRQEIYVKGEFKNIMHFALCKDQYGLS